MTTISTTSNEGTLTITTDDGHLDSASAVLVIKATNREYNQPALHIEQAGEHGGAASIRIDDPNPDIEFVETGRKVLIPAPGSSRLPFSRTNSRSMAAAPWLAQIRKASILLSYFNGRQRAAISVSDSMKL